MSLHDSQGAAAPTRAPDLARRTGVRLRHRRKAAATLALTGIGLATLAAVPARAAGTPAAPARAASAPISMLSAVTVKGIAYGAHAVALPSTVSVLGRRALTRGQPQVNLSESLGQVPGLVVQDRQNYAQDLQIAIRGFGADAPFGVQDVYMTLDGIPLTMPDGQGQSQIIDLPTIGAIKVIKGPFAALYGNAAGGVIEAYTRDAPVPPAVSLRYWTGPWGSHQTTLVGGGRSGKVDGLVGLTDFSTDGWREHSAANRKQLNAKLHYRASDDTQFTLVMNALNQDALDPAGLTRKELQLNPRGVDPSILAYDTRKTVRNRQVGLVWRQRLSPDDNLQVSVYDGTRRIVQYLPFSGSFGKSAGGVVDLHDYFGGTTAQYAHSGSLAGRPITVAAGVDYGRENEYRKGFVNDFGSATALRNDQFNTVDNTAEYAQAHWDLTDRLAVSGGVRHDQVRFDSANAADAPFAPGTGGGASYGSTDPVVGLLYRLDAHTRLYADYGHGFVTPTFYQLAYRPDGSPGLNFALQPMHLRNTEIGLRSQWGRVRLDASAYYVTTDNQIVVDTSTGGRTTYANAGKTRRYGTDIALTAALPRHLQARLAYSAIDVRFDGGPFNGKFLPGVPRQQLYAALTWAPPLAGALHGFYTTVQALLRAHVYVDNANSDAAQGYGVVNWVAGLRQSRGHWRLSEFVRVDNVLDHSYIGAVVVGDTNGRFFEAAPGRNTMVGAQVTREF